MGRGSSKRRTLMEILLDEEPTNTGTQFMEKVGQVLVQVGMDQPEEHMAKLVQACMILVLDIMVTHSFNDPEVQVQAL